VTELNDIDLIQATAQGDADALLLLYDRYNRLAFGLAYRILGNPSFAEEAVQDAYLQVWNRAASFDVARGSNVRGWLMTIVHNRSIDIRRRDIDHKPAHVPLEDAEHRLSVPDVWRDVSAGLTQETMRSAVATLPQDQRRAIELAFFEGLSHGEIAEQEQTPLGTIKGRMRLGLRKLRTVLIDQHAGPEGYEHDTERGHFRTEVG
jgi:RNA polymerase sigma-70 factor (ECF subfamily)